MTYVSLGTYKRDLSVRQAVSCEWAMRPKCVCRCAGAMHSAARALRGGGVGGVTGQLLAELNRIKAIVSDIEREQEITRLLKTDHGQTLRSAYDALPPNDPHHDSTEPERRDRSLYRKAHKDHANTAVAAMTYAVGAYEVCPICLDEGRASPISGDAERPLIAAPV
jgi:hypothetical protein